jgi:hypothetical protein
MHFLTRMLATSTSLFSMDNRRSRCFSRSRASLSQRSLTVLQERNTHQVRVHLKAMIWCIREEDLHSLQNWNWKHLLIPENQFNTIPLTISNRRMREFRRMINTQETQLVKLPNSLSSISLKWEVQVHRQFQQEAKIHPLWNWLPTQNSIRIWDIRYRASQSKRIIPAKVCPDFPQWALR